MSFVYDDGFQSLWSKFVQPPRLEECLKSCNSTAASPLSDSLVLGVMITGPTHLPDQTLCV